MTEEQKNKLRDEIAINALNGMLGARWERPEDASKKAYEYADAMLKARGGSDAVGVLAEMLPHFEGAMLPGDENAEDLAKRARLAIGEGS